MSVNALGLDPALMPVVLTITTIWSPLITARDAEAFTQALRADLDDSHRR